MLKDVEAGNAEVVYVPVSFNMKQENIFLEDMKALDASTKNWRGMDYCGQCRSKQKGLTVCSDLSARPCKSCNDSRVPCVFPLGEYLFVYTKHGATGL